MWPRALALFLSRVDFYVMLSRKEEAAVVVCCVVEDNHSDAPGPRSLSAVLILHQHPLVHPEPCACWQEWEIEQHVLQPRWSRAAVSVPTVTQLRFSSRCTLAVSYHYHSSNANVGARQQMLSVPSICINGRCSCNRRLCVVSVWRNSSSIKTALPKKVFIIIYTFEVLLLPFSELSLLVLFVLPCVTLLVGYPAATLI